MDEQAAIQKENRFLETEPVGSLIRKYSRDFDGTLSDAECIRLIGISRNTYYKYKSEMRGY